MTKRILKAIHDLKMFFFGAIVILFLYHLGLTPVDMGRFVGAGIGRAVGMAAGVPENPTNKLALELKEKEERLAVREQELTRREQALAQSAFFPFSMEALMAGGIVVLFFLIAFNYYLDYRRRDETARTGVGDR